MKALVFLLLFGGALALGWECTHASLDPALLRRATQEYATRKGQLGNAKYITVVDYQLAIYKPRLFVYDVAAHRVVLQAHVSHALKSGLLYATEFSNEVGSEKSCEGVFITQQHSYQGKFGKALRLTGVSKGLNDQAEARAIVLHEDPGYRFSKGCLMTSEAVNDHLTSLLQGRSLLVVYK
ncbi:MAG: hypothetical protein EOO60_12085 [Hymenobacter sp.]|nr:MAG: hypothetical protein EOO60_12085 [Hymenobacter sp.]